jgi:uncharacterized protein (TIGR02284 family)
MVTYSTALSDKATECLQDLIRYNIDAYKGFNEAADQISHASVAALFREMGAERQRMAEELKRYVAMSDEEPRDSGHARGAIHRAWIDLRAALNGGDPHVILIEAERGEDAIKDAYKNALDEVENTPVRELLMRQYAQVKDAHDRVRELRDSFKGR